MPAICVMRPGSHGAAAPALAPKDSVLSPRLTYQGGSRRNGNHVSSLDWAQLCSRTAPPKCQAKCESSRWHGHQGTRRAFYCESGTGIATRRSKWPQLSPPWAWLLQFLCPRNPSQPFPAILALPPCPSQHWEPTPQRLLALGRTLGGRKQLFTQHRAVGSPGDAISGAEWKGRQGGHHKRGQLL